MDEDPDIDGLKDRMEKSVDSLRREFAGLRTGRATASMLDAVVVDAYGAKMPIQQLATVNIPEPRMILVSVWDRSVVEAVESAIRKSNLGINPVSEGATIRLPIPELNEERRREIAKVAGGFAEQARIAIRNVRRDGMEELRKLRAKGMSEDDQRLWQTEIQELTDRSVALVDEALAAKEKELLNI